MIWKEAHVLSVGMENEVHRQSGIVTDKWATLILMCEDASELPNRALLLERVVGSYGEFRFAGMIKDMSLEIFEPLRATMRPELIIQLSPSTIIKATLKLAFLRPYPDTEASLSDLLPPPTTPTVLRLELNPYTPDTER